MYVVVKYIIAETVKIMCVRADEAVQLTTLHPKVARTGTTTVLPELSIDGHTSGGGGTLGSLPVLPFLLLCYSRCSVLKRPPRTPARHKPPAKGLEVGQTRL